MILGVAVLLASVVTLGSAAVVEPNIDDVWMLSYNYSSYAYSKITYSFVALRPDGLHVDWLDLETKRTVETFILPIPGYRLAIGHTGTHVTVVHNSYITFINLLTKESQTENFPYADVPVNGLVADLTSEHESCGWLHIYQSSQYVSEIVCVNPTNGNASKCYDQGGSYGYTATTLGTADGKYIYGLTSSGYVIKYYVPDVTPSPVLGARCPLYQYYRHPNWGSFYTPHAAWFSYDRSRIFFDNGLTLTASTDSTIDLQEHGSFNGSFTNQYLYWVDQDPTESSSHTVVALRRIYDYSVGQYMLVVNRYTWPYLEALKITNAIPVPSTPSGLKVNTYGVGSQVHFGTKATQLVAVVNYTMNNLIYGPGVAYITA